MRNQHLSFLQNGIYVGARVIKSLVFWCSAHGLDSRWTLTALSEASEAREARVKHRGFAGDAQGCLFRCHLTKPGSPDKKSSVGVSWSSWQEARTVC